MPLRVDALPGPAADACPGKCATLPTISVLEEHVRSFVSSFSVAAFGQDTILSRCFFVDPLEVRGRVRNLLPLPHVTDDILRGAVADFLEPGQSDIDCLRSLCRLTVLSLNSLAARKHPTAVLQREPTKAQRASLAHICRRCFSLLMRLSKFTPEMLAAHSYLREFEPDSAPARPAIVSTHIDLPSCAATCDPMRLVRHPMRGMLARLQPTRMSSLCTRVVWRLSLWWASMERIDFDQFGVAT